MHSSIPANLVSLRKAAGLRQRDLAERAQCSRETIIRLENGEEVGWHIVLRVVEQLGAGLQIVPTAPGHGKGIAASARRAVLPCRVKYRHLVWSNPDAADDDSFMRAALLNPHALVLADFTREYGLPRMRAAWASVAATPEGKLRADTVERMLRNFEIGLQHACKPEATNHAAAA